LNVTVRSIGLVRQVMGSSQVEVDVPEGTTISGLLMQLAAEKGERFAPFAVETDDKVAYAPLRVMVNGRDLTPAQRKTTVLEEGDDVLMFLPIAGG
jgi:molybdopterin converting factor small subunit